MSEEIFDFGGNDVEDNVERVGGFAADESAVYTKGITQAYLSISKNGAYAINLATKNKEGDERNYQFYFTNRAGQTFYTKGGKKMQLPGYALLNAICMLTCNQTAQQVLSKPKKQVIDLMDWESRKEVPTEVKTYPQICKKALKLGIVKVISNAYNKGKITNTKREQNEIKMVFNAKSLLTITELAGNLDEPKLHAQWVKTWAGREDDQFVLQEAVESVEEGDDPFGADDDDADENKSTKAADTASKSKPAADDVEEDEDDMFD